MVILHLITAYYCSHVHNHFMLLSRMSNFCTLICKPEQRVCSFSHIVLSNVSPLSTGEILILSLECPLKDKGALVVY